MKIVVVGSTGRTGRHLLAQGVARGHRVTAFTRRPHLLADPGGLATVVPGDGRDPAAVRRAVAGADAVIVTVPGGTGADRHQAADVARAVVSAMTDLGLSRLVVTSAYPIVADRPRALVGLLRLVLRTPYADLEAMEDLVQASGLDWTIARLTRLTDRPADGRVEMSTELLARPRAVSRADAATVLLDLAEDRRHTGTAVNVSGGAPAPRPSSP